MMVRSN